MKFGLTSSWQSYDHRGRQAHLAASSLTAMLAYNHASQFLSETYSGDPLNDLAVTNAYDAYMRRSAIALKTQTATLTQFDDDPAGRLQDLPTAVAAPRTRILPTRRWSARLPSGPTP